MRCAGCREPAQRFAGRDGPLRLLVVGGSLGAQALNELVPAAVAPMPVETRPQIVHQSGEKHIGALREAYARAGVAAECVAFIDDMAARYAWADFAICRGGALTISELAAVGLGSIVVPLPGAIADEQSANAQFLVDAGAAWKEPQAALTPQRACGSGCNRSIARVPSRWRRPRTRRASATPPRAWRTCASNSERSR